MGEESGSEEEEEEFEVEAIIDSRIRRGKTQYLVKWKDWKDEDNTWESEDNINSKDLIEEYNKNKEEKETGKETAVATDNLNSKNENPEESDDEEEEEYEVEAILDKRSRRGKIQYLVKWKGWPDEDNSWELQSNITCEDLINVFNAHKKQNEILKMVESTKNEIEGKDSTVNEKQADGCIPLSADVGTFNVEMKGAADDITQNKTDKDNGVGTLSTKKKSEEQKETFSKEDDTQNMMMDTEFSNEEKNAISGIIENVVRRQANKHEVEESNKRDIENENDIDVERCIESGDPHSRKLEKGDIHTRKPREGRSRSKSLDRQSKL